MPLAKVLDDLSNLLYKLPRTVEKDSAGTITFPFRYRSSLKKWAGDRVYKPVKPIGASQLEEAKKCWKECIQSNNFAALTQRNVRMLCSDGNIVRSAEFATYLGRQVSLFTPRIVRMLVPTLHQEWQLSPDSHKILTETTHAWIQQYSGKDKTLLLWKANADELLSAFGPQRMGQQVMDRLKDSGVLLQELRIKTGMSLFAVAANDFALTQLSYDVSKSSEPQQDQWSFLLEKLLMTGLASHAAKERSLGQLIMTLRNAHGQVWHQSREELKTFILTNKDFGDPRLHPERWAKLSREVVETLVAWLSEEDIEFFFNLIFTDDPHGRKAYWLRFVPHVKASRVAVSSKDKDKHFMQLQEWQKKGRDFAHISGSASVFILDFGGDVAVEFSKVGNACFIYDKADFEKGVGSLYQKNFTVAELKYSKYWHRQTHTDGWQTDLNYELSKVGLRPIGRKL